MRPHSLYHSAAQDLLKIYLQATNYYKAQRTCNQFYVAKKIKEEFVNIGYGFTPYQLSDLDNKNIIEKYSININHLYAIAYYLRSGTPAAIVQMCKRIKKAGT